MYAETIIANMVGVVTVEKKSPEQIKLAANAR